MAGIQRRTGKEGEGSGDGERERVHALWDALADFPAARIDEARDHLMRTLCGWVGADNAVWIGAVRMAHHAAAARDPQHGWRGRMTHRLVPMPEIAEAARLAMFTQDSDPAMTSCAIAAGAGRHRVQRLRDGFVDFAAFSKTRHYRLFYEGMGIRDRIWVASPVNADAESYFLFDIHAGRRRFSAADAGLAYDVLRGLKWFHRSLMLSYGLMLAQTALSPTQRRVLALLLTGKSEKEIAHDLSLTPGTTHQYVVELFRKFMVNSRAGLMALWLQGRHPPPEPPTDS
jgi:DNA-binding CsgD family transcriptional regulator